MSCPNLTSLNELAYNPRVFIAGTTFAGPNSETCLTVLTDLEQASDLVEEHDFYLVGAQGYVVLKWLSIGTRDFWKGPGGQSAMDESYSVPSEVDALLVFSPDAAKVWAKEHFEDMAEYGRTLEWQAPLVRAERSNDMGWMLEHKFYRA